MLRPLALFSLVRMMPQAPPPGTALGLVEEVPQEYELLE